MSDDHYRRTGLPSRLKVAIVCIRAAIYIFDTEGFDPDDCWQQLRKEFRKKKWQKKKPKPHFPES